MFGERLKFLLEEKGMTQKRLAELSGCAETTISFYVHDKFNPQVNKVKKIAEVLGVNPSVLLKDNRPVFRKKR